MNKRIDLLLVFLFIALILTSCSKQKNINPVSPPPITTGKSKIDTNLLTGWWAPTANTQFAFTMYFGTDHFYFLDTTKHSPPGNGYWRINQDSIYYSPGPNGYATLVFAVSKLTSDSLVFSFPGSSITGPQKFYKLNKASITSKAITTIAGSESGNGEDNLPATQANIYGSGGIITDKKGNIFFCDPGNSKVEEITVADGIIHTIAGTGSTNPKAFVNNIPALSADLINPTFLAMDSSGNLYVSEGNVANRIDKISAIDGTITCVAGSLATQGGFSGDGGLAINATLNRPQGIAVDATGNIYIADQQNNRIRKISSSNGIINTIAGTGNDGYSGDGGPATSAALTVQDISLDALGNIYFTDYSHHRIRKIGATNRIITTVAGKGTAGHSVDGNLAVNSLLNLPFGLKLGSDGTIYFSETGNYDVCKIDGSTGVITKIAGTGFSTYDGDGIHATAFSFISPRGVTIDSQNNVYVNDAFRIRKIAAK